MVLQNSMTFEDQWAACQTQEQNLALETQTENALHSRK